MILSRPEAGGPEELETGRCDLAFARAFFERARDLLAEAVHVEAAQLHGLELGMIDRIDGLAVVQNLEVQVRAGRAARAADEPYELAAHHGFAGLDAGCESHEMAVDRGELAAVLDADPIAVAAVGRRANDHAVSSGIDRRAGRRDQVHA